jgi:hypothetical protein
VSPKPTPQGDRKSKSNAWQRPRKRGPAYILFEEADWTPEYRDAKLKELREQVNSIPPTPGAPFIIFEHLDGSQERLDRNP